MDCKIKKDLRWELSLRAHLSRLLISRDVFPGEIFTVAS